MGGRAGADKDVMVLLAVVLVLVVVDRVVCPPQASTNARWPPSAKVRVIRHHVCSRTGYTRRNRAVRWWREWERGESVGQDGMLAYAHNVVE